MRRPRLRNVRLSLDSPGRPVIMFYDCQATSGEKPCPASTTSTATTSAIRRSPIARQSNDNLVVKILAIIGGFLVVVVLVCGGLAFYALSSFKQGAQRMEDDFAKVVEKQQETLKREQER